MKKLFMFALVFIFCAGLSAQEINVPKEVKESFAKLYPKVTDVKWDKEGKDEFEASFKMDGKSVSVVIEENGDIESTETSIEMSELPKAAVELLKSDFKEYTITETAKIVDEDDVVTYEAEVTKGKEKKDILFNSEGKQITKASKAEETEETKDDED